MTITKHLQMGKAIIILLAINSIFVLSACRQGSSEANIDKQTKEAEQAFDEALAIPDFTIALTPDSLDFSSTSLAKDGLLLIQYFSPDCDHCQEEAKTFVAKKDSLQNIKTLWISGNWIDLEMIVDFQAEYQLDALKPLAVGKEADNFLVSHYGLTGTPFTAVYKDNQLIKEYSGSIDFAELIEINYGTYQPNPTRAEPE